MKADNLDAFRKLATDYLAGELSEKEKQGFLDILDGNETFMSEFRLMEQVWNDAERLNLSVDVPPMSRRLKDVISGQKYGGELGDDELDMVSGGIKNEPEIDDEI